MVGKGGLGASATLRCCLQYRYDGRSSRLARSLAPEITSVLLSCNTSRTEDLKTFEGLPVASRQHNLRRHRISVPAIGVIAGSETSCLFIG